MKEILIFKNPEINALPEMTEAIQISHMLSECDMSAEPSPIKYKQEQYRIHTRISKKRYHPGEATKLLEDGYSLGKLASKTIHFVIADPMIEEFMNEQEDVYGKFISANCELRVIDDKLLKAERKLFSMLNVSWFKGCKAWRAYRKAIKG